MFLRLEILLFFTSCIYIFYYIFDYFYTKTLIGFQRKRNKNLLFEKENLFQEQLQQKQENEQESYDTAQDSNEDTVEKKYIPERFTPEKGEQLREMIKRAQTNISRGYFETARAIVIEGLAMKKRDKELNILLAEIYEREKKYQPASYVYQDLLEEFPEDAVILQKLGNTLFLLGDTKSSYDIYQEAHSKNRTQSEVIDILSHLALDMKDYKSALKYANLFLKNTPRNTEKLGIKAYSLEKLGRIREAIESYKKILDIHPYDSEITQRIKILESQS